VNISQNSEELDLLNNQFFWRKRQRASSIFHRKSNRIFEYLCVLLQPVLEYVYLHFRDGTIRLREFK
jgi:hypothetical protein